MTFLAVIQRSQKSINSGAFYRAAPLSFDKFPRPRDRATAENAAERERREVRELLRAQVKLGGG